MARRKKAAGPKKVPAAVHRSATPRRSVMALTPRSGALASMLATGATLGTAAGGLAPAVSAAAAATVVGAIGAKIQGRTLGEWIALRRGVSDLPDQAALFDRDGVGIIFDGRTASACVEITPRPWQLTTITATGASQAPTISADQLRRQLTQYDIRCSRLTAICAGYKFAARDNGAGVLDTLIGPVSAPLGGTTVIVVSLDLEADVLAPAYRRAPKNRTSGAPSLPDGLCRTLTLAATRVSHSLAETGFGGQLMSAQRVRAFHDAVLRQVAAPLANPEWDLCGQPKSVHTRTYTPARGYWTAEAAGAWNHLQSHRQYTTLTLTPQGDSEALAQPLITYLVNGSESLSKAVGYGLRSAVGQQVAGINQALPISTHVPLHTPGAIIDEHHQLEFGVPAGGAGLFVGSRADKTRVFVATPPADDPLWLCGPQLFALQMVARLSTQDLRIAVMVDDPVWRNLLAHRKTPTLTFGSLGSVRTDAVVCTPEFWERNREQCAGKAVILVSEDDPGRLATNSLSVSTSVDGTSQITVRVDAQESVVGWELTPLERRTLLGDVDKAGVSPVEGVKLQLGEVVQLPVAPPRRKRRRSAPAPVVPTVAAVDPEAPVQDSFDDAAYTAQTWSVPPAAVVPSEGEVQFVAPAESPAVRDVTPTPRPRRRKPELAAPVIEFAPAADVPAPAEPAREVPSEPVKPAAEPVIEFVAPADPTAMVVQVKESDGRAPVADVEAEGGVAAADPGPSGPAFTVPQFVAPAASPAGGMQKGSPDPGGRHRRGEGER